MIPEMGPIVTIKVIFYISIGWVFYFWGYRKFRKALLKYKLSVLKHTLFLKTYDMQISFEAPAYKKLDEFLGSLLDNTDLLNFSLCLLIWRLERFDSDELEDFEGDLKKELESPVYNKEYREFVTETYEKMTTAISLHIITGAPIFYPFFLFYFIVGVAREIRKEFQIKNFRISVSPSIRYAIPKAAIFMSAIKY